MTGLVLPDSSYFISCARAGVDPFKELRGHSDEWEFATCGIVVLEVCRGRRDPSLYQRFLERFAVMIFVPSSNAIWERATQLAWGMHRQGIVIPATDILIAATALHVDATVLTSDAHFRQVPGLEVLDRLGPA